MVTVTLSSSSTMRTLGGIRGWPSDRQGHAEYGTAARAVAHLEPAAVALRDPEAHPEAEAGALLPFRGEERLEDVRQVILRDPRSGVGDLEPNRARPDKSRCRARRGLGRERP